MHVKEIQLKGKSIQDIFIDPLLFFTHKSLGTIDFLKDIYNVNGFHLFTIRNSLRKPLAIFQRYHLAVSLQNPRRISTLGLARV